MSTPFSQNTIKNTGSIHGVGVHGGCLVNMVVHPAPLNTGIVFRVAGKKRVEIKASWQNVTSTHYSTVLSHEGVSISTVEHVLAALWSQGLSNLFIEIDGPEVPILDGSAQVWMDFFTSLGREPQSSRMPALTVHKACWVRHQESWLHIAPSQELRIDMFTSLDDGTMHAFSYRHCDREESFLRHIAGARTFSFQKHIEAMRERGLIKGGSLDNALVLHEGKALNALGLRYDNECARHKILDFIGDWALSGARFCGHITGFNSGHTLNHRLLTAVLQTSAKKCRARTSKKWPAQSVPLECASVPL
ncbi:UDP-3-O-acyl-N-acetylglucosamine deacetylase [Candidatus Hepatobacter penaei]|uniref:UDP-3-O-acyl-N-acetylglucosamine deacetylase n=1 Tax=Candidatus Hepatobacter penaei TaxID=1274402 RepID=UPI0004F30C1F|nr:UDP-3-O-acyl-N-acetylglucosamine deacetylase [Candidatus Hepatobacter penaei]